MTLNPADFAFVGKPERRRTNPPESRPSVWVTRFAALEPGDGVAIYNRNTKQLVLEYAEANGIGYSVTKFRGGGWRVIRL